ncbi:MAG TPA: tetratricopeptide repeat protein [Bryobacteraceae bacterium]|jgi:tetratricopeptide (TPR) repeat protein|nr:tetratricopeptide repeat protein [Bryobacteraceae bacterium]
MNAVRLFFSLWAVASSGPAFPTSDEFQKLASCIDHKDQACVAASLQNPPQHPSAEYLARAARGYLLLGRKQEAVESINHATQLEPDRYEYLMEQGWLYQRCGDQVSAIESFLHASKINPQSSQVFYELGMSFFFAKENERAIRHFNHALQLDPKNDKAEFMIGVVYLWMDQLDGTRLHFENALKLQPENAHYHLHYGVLLERLRELDPRPMAPNERDPALENLLEARRLDPSNSLARYQLGKLYRKRGTLAEAQTELEAAVRLQPTLSPAVYQLALLYRQMGQESKARAAFEKHSLLTQHERTDEYDPIDANLAE